MSNINEDYIEEYIRSITPKNKGLLLELEEYAKRENVPIIEEEVGQMIKLLLKIKEPKNILELGTAIGYSSIYMCQALGGNCNITTIERDEKMVYLAKENIKKAGYENNIRVIYDDARRAIELIDNKFDLIFIDAGKGHYKEFFDKSIEKLEDKGLIISDNILFKGMVASDDLVKRRKRTIVNRLREYLDYINNLDGYTTSVIPIGDGVALTYKEV